MVNMNFLHSWASNKLKYSSDRTIKEKLEIIFVKDHKQAIKFRIFNLILKIATCVLYIIEVMMSYNTSHFRSNFKSNNILHSTTPEPIVNSTESNSLGNETIEETDDISWDNILFVKRHPYVQTAQLTIAIYGLLETIFYFVLTYNGNLFQRLINPYRLIEMICTVSWIIEYCVPEANDIYIPVFLNCWLIKRNLSYIFKDFNNITVKHQNSVIGQHIISLSTVLGCLAFSSVCGFEHLQRANINNSVSLSDSLYYIIITFSTVGYGDITPDTWPSKFFMAVMILVALIVIPTQLEHLVSLWVERQNLGASYSSHRSTSDRHIVVCTTALSYDLIVDFLNEFYAHRKNQSIHTVLLSSSEIDIQLRSLLHTPIWKQRVFYIHGSALRDSDLDRAQVAQAKAVFIIPSRGIDKDMADQHTILRSWAIKDFAPNTPQFVQLFRPENTINIKFAEYLVCEDEFKYALLANNCLCPGISTLLTLLLHKSTSINSGLESSRGTEDWQDTYAKLAGNEVHSIQAGTSKLFQEFVGRSFTDASCFVHKRYNICLIGIIQSKASCSKESLIFEGSNLSQAANQFSNRNVLLNPGPNYIIGEYDMCLYVALVKEENFNFKEARYRTFAVEELCHNLLISGPDLTMRDIAKQRIKNELESSMDGPSNYSYVNLVKRPSIRSQSSKYSYVVNDSDLVISKPLSPFYIGCNPTQCKLLKVNTPLCCLELNRECEHKKNMQAADYKWKNRCILVTAEYANSGLYNFILPLRSKSRSTMFLKPIVLLIEKGPSIEFLESICCFPLVYWMQGNISNINTILKAGIMDSDYIIVVSPEKYAHIDDDSLTDCSNIVAVQNLYRLFPKVKVVTELTKASNIRFMKTQAKEILQEHTSCKLPYMFRLPFSSGSVFSASMLDTLLYQTYGKPYLIELIRLLIGISQTPGSANITSLPLTISDMWLKSYGNLYRKLVTTTGEIPIGLYRFLDEKETHKKIYDRQSSKVDNIKQMVLTRMHKLGIDSNKYSANNDGSSVSFVLINPANDFNLQPGDIVYMLKPAGNSLNIKSEIRQDSKPSDQVVFNLSAALNQSESDEERSCTSPNFLTPLNSPQLTNTLTNFLKIDNSENGDFIGFPITSKTAQIINTEDENKIADMHENCRI